MDPDAVDAAERVPHGGTDDRGLLEFSANLNPERPDGVGAAYERALESADRYPDDDYPAFRDAAAASVDRDGDRDVGREHVVPTPGGLAALRLAFATTLTPGDEVLVPAPSFGEYAREVELQGATASFVAHDAIVDLDDVALEGAAMVVVCNPNNPTGEAVDAAALRALAARCRAADTTLVVDEAFLGFTDEPTLAGEPGVVVARSLTKVFGLPGLRMGFAVATGDLRDRLDTARPAWGLSTPAAEVGAYCLRRTKFVAETRARVRRERRRMRDALDDRFDVHPSEAPFLLLETETPVETLVADARRAGVAIRDATTFRGLDDHVRVAVRRPAENDRLLDALS